MTRSRAAENVFNPWRSTQQTAFRRKSKHSHTCILTGGLAKTSRTARTLWSLVLDPACLSPNNSSQLIDHLIRLFLQRYWRRYQAFVCSTQNLWICENDYSLPRIYIRCKILFRSQCDLIHIYEYFHRINGFNKGDISTCVAGTSIVSWLLQTSFETFLSEVYSLYMK